MSDATHEEWSLFKGISPEIFTTNLVNVKDAIKNNAVYNLYISNINSINGTNGAIKSQINMQGMHVPDIATPEGLIKFYQNNPEEFLTIQQMSKNHMNEANLNKIIRFTSIELISYEFRIFQRPLPDWIQCKFS